MYHAQLEQDKILNEKFFKNKKYGIFLDVGAHDGETASNTCFFERELYWTGICIEPIPKIYDKLKKCRNCICINACAYNKEGTTTFNMISGYSEMLSGIDECYPDIHKQRITRELEQKGGKQEKIEVKTVVLKDVLSKQNITHVDYFSLDTEGSELQVLQGIDFDKVTFDVIDIEINYPWLSQQIYDLLDSAGYKHVMTMGGQDHIFVPK